MCSHCSTTYKASNTSWQRRLHGSLCVDISFSRMRSSRQRSPPLRTVDAARRPPRLPGLDLAVSRARTPVVPHVFLGTLVALMYDNTYHEFRGCVRVDSIRDPSPERWGYVGAPPTTQFIVGRASVLARFRANIQPTFTQSKILGYASTRVLLRYR